MVTLIELVNATTWLDPQDHIKISVWDKSKVYEDGEFEDIKFNIRTLVKYAHYYVSDIDIDFNEENKPILVCLISKE